MGQSEFTETTFTSLHLADPLLRGVADAGFERCTPIQAQTLPLALADIDVAGQAQTGTGKTAAFLLATYQHLIKNPPAADRRTNDPLAIMIAPTRELAIQIAHDADVLGQYTGFGHGVVYGGTDYDKQRRMLADGVDILIGTPGRIIDYYKQRVYDLRAIQVVVLDEADRMFDLGFIKDIRYVLRRLPRPEKRLNMLFSATLSHRVLELAYEHMNDPKLIRIDPENVTADRVRQAIYFPSNQEKIPLLIGLLRKMDVKRTMIFVNTKRGAELLERYLNANDFSAAAISGDVPQRKRMRMLGDFKEGKLAILIGTDVASRGLHIPDVSHVINFDLPQDAEDYVHRIGRTARIGADGDAISLGCEDYVVSLPDIEAFIGYKIPAKQMDPGLFPDVKPPLPAPRRGARHRPGKRPGHRSSDAKDNKQPHRRRRQKPSQT